MLSEEPAEQNRGAEEVGQHEGMDDCGCPKWWCWSNGTIGGTEGTLPCSGVEEGGLPSKRERRSRCRSSCWGGAGNGGLAAGCPQAGGAIAVRWEAEEC
ncbi:hypothetical protein ROHU_014391 [Labeo rohita]|uniref:Uncharacterized protein n=1 Tax=Labeo rohita TaxID=84645 RepID=A0A498NSQ0_LABRO|nr:hypothetical protein ROHU_014391 [Labeo rohita]